MILSTPTSVDHCQRSTKSSTCSIRTALRAGLPCEQYDNLAEPAFDSKNMRAVIIDAFPRIRRPNDNSPTHPMDSIHSELIRARRAVPIRKLVTYATRNLLFSLRADTNRNGRELTKQTTIISNRFGVGQHFQERLDAFQWMVIELRDKSHW